MGNLQSLYIQIDMLRTVAYNLTDSSTERLEFTTFSRGKVGLIEGTVMPITFGTESKHQWQSADI